ncbi:TetR/AcrR family transcriptional regulator [Mesorhizobium sp. ES1-3]|uniref:TetR/AcrR family transcriptional regulator n=1 Tax=Mesorhizobium sp. ES1-3 TaxID=2876628 RepID=UPI001CC97C56|nr:TetR/AcrR family transcriptional regulator [Mesorhizobium sp. ES1-3]MBZ9673064.1 TetR/AcrR family transcriptional regulator [Mesorhizobium sp. ES1-3]
MTRPKTRSDEQVLEAALRLIYEHGPEALTFERLAKACGLSGATLVQRFKNKAQLKQRTLLHAWDGLDDKTGTVAAAVPRTPAGAIELLVALSQGYGGIETYAEGLLVLREDLRDPVLRARGAAWKAVLCAALSACFAEIDDPPQDLGLLMASHWQGSLLWWSFDPTIEVAVYVEASLNRFVAAITTETARKP